MAEHGCHGDDGRRDRADAYRDRAPVCSGSPCSAAWVVTKNMGSRMAHHPVKASGLTVLDERLIQYLDHQVGKTRTGSVEDAAA